MPLVQATLKADIKAIFVDAKSRTTNPDAALDAIADALATKIIATIKTATITIPIGAVVVTGSAVTQLNPAPITGLIIT
jgi:hypothetical protein